MSEFLSGASAGKLGGELAPVTIIGLGPMGQALAGAFVNSGHPVTVWNRTAGKADALIAQGASLAETVAEALAASPLTIVCVLDYHAAQSVLEQAGEALQGRTVVNLTADTPAWARQMAAWASERGAEYLDGAIMTPTQTIGTQAAVVLYSGPAAVYEVHRHTLATIGGTASYLGSDPGRAAAYDVALLDIFWTAMSGYVHALALADAEHIAPGDFAGYAKGIAAIMPAIMEEFAHKAAAGDHPGNDSNIISAAAGMEHIIQTSRHHGIDDSVLSAAQAIARQAIDSGHGKDNFSRLFEVLRKPSA